MIYTFTIIKVHIGNTTFFLKKGSIKISINNTQRLQRQMIRKICSKSYWSVNFAKLGHVIIIIIIPEEPRETCLSAAEFFCEDEVCGGRTASRSHDTRRRRVRTVSGEAPPALLLSRLWSLAVIVLMKMCPASGSVQSSATSSIVLPEKTSLHF